MKAEIKRKRQDGHREEKRVTDTMERKDED